MNQIIKQANTFALKLKKKHACVLRILNLVCLHESNNQASECNLF